MKYNLVWSFFHKGEAATKTIAQGMKSSGVSLIEHCL